METPIYRQLTLTVTFRQNCCSFVLTERNGRTSVKYRTCSTAFHHSGIRRNCIIFLSFYEIFFPVFCSTIDFGLKEHFPEMMRNTQLWLVMEVGYTWRPLARNVNFITSGCFSAHQVASERGRRRCGDTVAAE